MSLYKKKLRRLMEDNPFSLYHPREKPAPLSQGWWREDAGGAAWAFLIALLLALYVLLSN